ncbi:MAG: phage holin family protein [Sciscionella sp.]
MAPVSTVPENTPGQADGSVAPAVPSIPLVDEGPYGPRAAQDGDASIGALVRDASTHLSTLVRAEVELARSEVVGEVKKGVKGSLFFIVALTVVLFSLFFGFITLAEGIHALGLPSWAAFGIVFVFMLLLAAGLGLIGYRKVRKIRAPERTISSVRDTATALRTRHEPGTEH